MKVQTPFLSEDTQGVVYESGVWPGLLLRKGERHVVLECDTPLDSIGSSVFGGGMNQIHRVVNIYVDRHYNCSDPQRDIAMLLDQWGYNASDTAGMLTAVQLRHTAVAEERNDDFSVACVATAGVSNAARAGIQRTTFPASWTPGTINVMLAVDGRLTPAAMVNTVITATEAKAAALYDRGVKDPENGLVATGTTTDSVVVSVSQHAKWPELHAYAGTATNLGGAVGRLVYAAVTASLEAAAGERR